MSIDKIINKLGEETVEELDRLNADELRRVVVQSQMSMEDAKQELSENREYLKAKESVDYLSASFKEVKARQSAKIKYSLHRLREMGKGA